MFLIHFEPSRAGILITYERREQHHWDWIDAWIFFLPQGAHTFLNTLFQQTCETKWVFLRHQTSLQRWVILQLGTALNSVAAFLFIICFLLLNPRPTDPPAYWSSQTNQSPPPLPIFTHLPYFLSHSYQPPSITTSLFRVVFSAPSQSPLMDSADTPR